MLGRQTIGKQKDNDLFQSHGSDVLINIFFESSVKDIKHRDFYGTSHTPPPPPLAPPVQPTTTLTACPPPHQPTTIIVRFSCIVANQGILAERWHNPHTLSTDRTMNLLTGKELVRYDEGAPRVPHHAYKWPGR